MKILIADDEDYSREGMIESMDWDDLGISEVMQAVNGREALKIAQWFHPDIILTDIRMPKMDGIHFAAELLKTNEDIKIIFISGYMEIEYLKSAIRLSAVDYIEKPIDLDKLKYALIKSVKEIREKRKSREVQEDYKDSQQQTLVSLLCGKDSDTMTIKKLAKEVAFPLHACYVCLIIQCGKKYQEQEECMKKILDILKSRNGKAVGRYDRDKKQFQIIFSYQKREQYHMIPLCYEILEAFPSAKIGLGIETENYKNIYNSYRTAGAAVNCAFYQEDQRLFQIDEGIQQKKMIEPRIYGEFLKILSKQPHMLREWFQYLFQDLYQNKYYQKEQVYILMTSLLTALCHHYPRMYGGYPGIDSEEQIQLLLYEMESLKEMEVFWKGVLSCVEKYDLEKAGHSRVVSEALDYIAQHYQEENLSVVQIADHLHLSYAYLNVLFKQEMKITIKQYLSNYRLERAKKMLEKDFERIAQIAEKCGYANANYFAKVFREAVGMTPAEYRKKKDR